MPRLSWGKEANALTKNLRPFIYQINGEEMKNILLASLGGNCMPPSFSFQALKLPHLPYIDYGLDNRRQN